MSLEATILIVGISIGYYMLAKVVDRLTEIRNLLDALLRRQPPPSSDPHF
ncbi:MAG: hypothetical protein IM667_06745 [Phenylobacterium sp.]|nr:hypothetical protein [Phenylobacterium sp.]MCA6240319.1 hypothetical protein [Phenylobacterium sp.]